MVQYSGTISVPNAFSVPNTAAISHANAISIHDTFATADYGASAVPDASACSGANALFGATTLPFGVGLRVVHLTIGLHKISYELRQLLLLRLRVERSLCARWMHAQGCGILC